MCSKSTKITTLVFGDDLAKQIKDISEVNKISRKVFCSSRDLRSSGSRTDGKAVTFSTRGKKGTFLRFRRGSSGGGRINLLTSQYQQPINKQDKQGQGLNEVVPCAGNLANHIANWREITTDPWTLEAVSGYRLELASQPYQLFTPSPINFSDSESAAVQSEIQTLLDKGAIEHVEYTQGEFISTLFLVPKKSGDLRPVINLKPVIFFVEKIHFKLENIDSTIKYVSPGD